MSTDVENFESESHPQAILSEAQDIVNNALGSEAGA